MKAQISITEATTKRRNEGITQLGELREQAVEREANLKRLLNESTTKLQAKEREVFDLQVANTEAKERLIKEEERNSRREVQQYEELQSQNRELQTMASQHLHMWKISKEQRTTLSNSYSHLQVEALVEIEDNGRF